MAGGTDVDGDAVVGEDVGGPSDVVPVVEPEREVVQRTVGALHERDVVRLRRPLEESDDLMTAPIEQLLGETKIQDLLEEPGDDRHFLRVDEQVIDARGSDAGEVAGDGRRVGERQPTADLVDISHELHLLSRGQLEANRLALTDLLTIGDTFDGMAGGLDPGFEVREVVGVLDLEGEPIEPDPRVVADREAVMIAFIPALEEDPVFGSFGDLETHHLRVVRSGELEVGDRDVDVAETENSHDGEPMTMVTYRKEASRIAGRRPAYASGVARNRLSSVANAARVMKSFSITRPVWRVHEMADHLGLSTSTTHRLLSTLTDEALLERDPETGGYRMGLTVFDLAAAAPTQRSLHEAAMVSMTELRSRTGQTVQIGVLDSRQVVYVERLDSPDTISVFREVGRRNHAHCTSTGKALLAALPIAQRERILSGWELPAVTEHTITDPDALRQELQIVGQQGYAENRQESELGVVSIAAPIRSATAEAIAALSLVGPLEAIDQYRSEFAAVVVALARTVSQQMA